jgi:D-xylonolactonase
VYDPATGEHAVPYEGRPVGGFTIQADGQLLLFRDDGNVVCFDGSRETRTVVENLPELAGTRFNDVIADPEGRVFAGTMSHPGSQDGKLYRIDCDGTATIVSDGDATPNGMGFTPDLTRMYFTDSRLRRIYLYDYHRTTGSLSGRRIFSETDAADVPRIGRSDGMTVDSNGNVWSARVEGGAVLELDAEARIVARIDLPARKVTSLTFGGADYRDLYVTSAGGPERPGQGAQAGAVFRVRPGVIGRPEFCSRVGV